MAKKITISSPTEVVEPTSFAVEETIPNNVEETIAEEVVVEPVKPKEIQIVMTKYVIATIPISKDLEIVAYTPDVYDDIHVNLRCLRDNIIPKNPEVEIGVFKMNSNFNDHDIKKRTKQIAEQAFSTFALLIR